MASIKKRIKILFLISNRIYMYRYILIIFSIFFYLTAIQSASIELGNLYYNTAMYGLMLIIPILTMRLFAEERKKWNRAITTYITKKCYRNCSWKVFCSINSSTYYISN